ncbi:MAG: transcription-repair coupling factor [Gemmataceae bacterium]|nr:transcription-repair coupling factor [Gemmataceae bacterium]
MAAAATPASETLADLTGNARATAGYAAVAAALRAGQSAAVDGAWGSSGALALAALADCGPTSLIVLAHPSDVDSWVADLESFAGARPLVFPPSEPARRLQVIRNLHGPSPSRYVVTTIAALIQPVPSREELAVRERIVRVGENLDLDEFSEWLVAHGYRRVDAVEVAGDFSRRGGIIDIFSPDSEHPVRCELFGDEVESLRRFAADTQRSVGTVDAVGILTQDGPEAEPARPSGHFVDHLPDKSWVALVEPMELTEQANRFRERSDPVGLFSTSGCMKQLLARSSVTVTGLPQATVEVTWPLRVESVERFSGKVDRVRDELDAAATHEQVVIACPTEAEIKRLAAVLAAGNLATSGRLALRHGYVRAGFRLVEAGIVVLGSHELFHREDPATVGAAHALPRRRIESRAIDSFLELNEGDLVVHVAHGIARFRGMTMLSAAGDPLSATGQKRKDANVDQSAMADSQEEHLVLEFKDGLKVYVPASKIDLVQKYVGGTKSDPELSKLGGTAWGRRTARVAEAVRDLAVEMLQMQAVRAAQPGFGYPPDSEWQREFEAAFPYQETTDQLAALKEIKADLERARPGDRLICGDVGFGKTELALRAAFKAVDNGKQVAVLVPTTVLAEQHFRTFTERFAEYPFTVACLNRFRPASEHRKILVDLAQGGVDVVIGTHRLTSPDVQFKDLGLVIIDEEQRFGVEHKDRLKRLRLTVDVLTLTATPIPRTLHLSLLGLRDISSLETPPAERLPIETRITRFDPTLIRSALLRELNREGQAYFVHNRVMDIHAVANQIRSIVPEVRVAVAHGQQSGDELEEAMLAFVQKRVDVLVATTIVESGLDIPNANTIFINQADRYGLADLHQLRGRVGRHKVRAYAYLLLDQDRAVTPDAGRRLKAIEEFTSLGAGFKIAIRDLEIRGAGNILGTQQSGHIAAVGYEMYCQLLENAVRQLKKMPARQATLDVSVDVPWPAYLPRDYIPGQKQRLEVYRRLSRVRDPGRLDDFRQELRDRYGNVPEPAEWLLRLVEVRLLASKWKLESLHRDGIDMVLTYTSEKHVRQLHERTGTRFRVVDGKQAYYKLTPADERNEHLYKTLRTLLAEPA